jgi:hypothetical protein
MTRLLTILILGLIVGARATDYCVGPTATGNGTGTNWSNLRAWSGATSVVRGDTWYLADGNYTNIDSGNGYGMEFTTAPSGTTLCTIKKATEAAHGPTNYWDSTYGDGQAVLNGTLNFQTDYWLFSGVTRNESDWFDDTAYGIKVVTPLNNSAATVCIWLAASYVDLNYVAVIAPVLPLDYDREMSLINWAGSPARVAANVSHCLVRNGCNHFFMRWADSCIVEYSASEGGKSIAAHTSTHGEVVNWYGYWGTSDNCILRYCIIRNNYDPGYGAGYSQGTAVIAMVDANGCSAYGNLIINNACGNGTIGINSSEDVKKCVGFKFYNNTIIQGVGDAGLTLPTLSTGAVASNNLWFGHSGYLPIEFSGITHDYNVSDVDSLGEAHDLIFTNSSIFVNYAGGDYHLATNIAGVALATAYNTDMEGNGRSTWTVGAFEYNGAPNTNPPSITSGDASGTVGSSFSYTITYSGATATSYGASNLPSGLSRSGNSITGTPTTAQTNAVLLAVTNDYGYGLRTNTFTISPAAAAPDPLPFIGTTNGIGSVTDGIGANFINGLLHYATANLILSNMHARITGITGKYKCAIYSDVAGEPTALLGQTLEATNPSTGWVTFPLVTPTYITNGHAYWLAIWANSSSAAIYMSSASNTVSMKYITSTYGAWPDPVSLGGFYVMDYSIYADGVLIPAAPSGMRVMNVGTLYVR